MLNYIWCFFIIIGIGFATFNDIKREVNPEKNRIEIISDSNDKNVFKIKPKEIKKIFEFNSTDTIKIKAFPIKNQKYSININDISSDELRKILKDASSKDILFAKIEQQNSKNYLIFEGTSFLSLKKITSSLISNASVAVEIAIGLIGIMALWLGILKIAETSGIILIIGNLLKPVMKFLFPSVPSDNPAVGSIIMNMSANMLGLGNAATPFGLKAMEELQKINKEKDKASNAMCMFLAINTAGFTLIPATCIAIRASLGSTMPSIIIGTTIFAAAIATFTGIFSAKVFELFSYKNKKENRSIFYRDILFLIATLVLGMTFFFTLKSTNNFEPFFKVINVISAFLIPLIIFSFIIYALIKKNKVYDNFIEGAKEGFNMAVKIIPYLVGMLVAIGILRASGALDIFINLLSPLTNLIGLPAESLSMALLRPLSGSASMGVMTEIMKQHGPDSFIGILVSTFYGSTETTFYVLAVYFGSVNIKKIRYSLASGIIADIAGILSALLIVKLMFG